MRLPRTCAALLTALLGLGAIAAESPGTNESERKIGPSDLLVITITGEKDLQTEFRVAAVGTIQFPFLEEVEVAGFTPAELRVRLRELLMKDYFVDPQVIVSVRDYRTDFVRVIGQVLRPGPISLPPDQKLDLFDIIAMAGGTTRTAKNTVEYTHNGVMQKFKLDDLKKETDPAKRIWVQPGDTIEVRESAF
ncbi:MAG TPA: polysaccharide biosynthesis/export family protein [Verrucomicrobiota bacterium]|nr:polysaccharide biosynthesis/export family protein [Verrucomicrobiota bacterium]HNU49593.1 polysaccharide biosynthesis/export family protein [Verrucomicrobiota bacterium]